MSKHSKKSGKGGGNRHTRGDARRMVRDPGVPDLRSIGRKLDNSARQRSLRRLGGIAGSSPDHCSSRQGHAPSILPRAPTPQLAASAGVSDDATERSAMGEEGVCAERARAEQQRHEMTTLALHTREKLHDFHATTEFTHARSSSSRHPANHHQDDDDDISPSSTNETDLSVCTDLRSYTHSNEPPPLCAEYDDAYSDGATQRHPAGHARRPPSRGVVDCSLRRFYKQFHRVVESCDVLLQVVDARDPLGCRLTRLEHDIRSRYTEDAKKIVLVLNKVDLLPSAAVAEAWVRYFTEQEKMMCVPFSAADRCVRAFSSFASGGPSSSSSCCVAQLFRCLRRLARAERGGDGGACAGERRAIVVGVIGYPNVGKSSVINALKRRQVVGVGNTPGFTTGSTEVDLRHDVRILDCPGVVAPGEDEGDVVLRNAVRVSSLANPFVAVQRLLQRCMAGGVDSRWHSANEVHNGNLTSSSSRANTDGSHVGRASPVDGKTNYRICTNPGRAGTESTSDAGTGVCEADVAAQHVLRATGVHPLALFYNIDAFDPSDTYDFVRKVGARRGRLIKGGAVDEESTARMILSDWNDGRIPYYTFPPAVNTFCNGALFARDGRRDDGDGDESLAPQLVSGASCGLTLDGLPTFHFSFHTASRGRFGKWASMPSAGVRGRRSRTDSDGEDVL